MSRLTCPRRADALVVLFFFPLLLFVKLLLFVLKEGVVAWWSCWLVVVSSPPSPSRWPWRRSVLPRRLLSESRRPTERNVVVISHTTNAGRDSYLKRHHLASSSRVQKGEIIITLLYNWSRCCFAAARSSFLSKKKRKVGKSSLSILCVYIYIERESKSVLDDDVIYIIPSQHKEKGRKQRHMKFRVLFFCIKLGFFETHYNVRVSCGVTKDLFSSLLFALYIICVYVFPTAFSALARRCSVVCCK